MLTSFARNMLLAMLVLLGTGCTTWSERTEANHVLAILNDGVKLHVGGDPEAAIRSYEKVLSITKDPEMKAAALGNIGLALTILGNTAAAQSKFKTVVTLTRHPETKARALNNIGELLQTQGQLDAARASYEEALRLTTHPDLQSVINEHLATLAE